MHQAVLRPRFRGWRSQSKVVRRLFRKNPKYCASRLLRVACERSIEWEA